MSENHLAHIDEQRLFQVLIEASSMSGPEDEHLARCARCRQTLENLSADLKILRRAGERYTPASTRRVTLPASTAPSRFGGLPYGWRVAAGVALSLCLAAVLWWPAGAPGPGVRPPQVAGGPGPVVPDPVMLETRMLAENAMPAPYQNMMESLDDGFDQGFIDFVIPPLDEDSLS
jgi:hypothetical protein